MLFRSANPAPLALYAAIDEDKQTNNVELSVPYALSFMVYNSPSGEVKGLKAIQADYTARFGPGNYIPNVTPVFWSFRIMVAAGLWLIAITLAGVYWLRKGRADDNRWILKAAVWTLPVPYIANSAGWFVTEGGRQPWIVYGLQQVERGVSPVVSAASIWTSLIGFTLLYGGLAVAGLYLMTKIAKEGPAEKPDVEVTSSKGVALWN